MRISGWIDAIYANAVAHGWHETNRSDDEVVALIHSEWSEALEEARSGRRNRWYRCMVDGTECIRDACASFHMDCCMEDRRKPEGVCVELIDGVIRIFDYLGAKGFRVTADRELNDAVHAFPASFTEYELTKLISFLHYKTAAAAPCAHLDKPLPALYLAAMAAMKWVEGQGYNVESMIREKHEYNKTRPYRHGKVF